MSEIYYSFCLNLLTFIFELVLISEYLVTKGEQLFDWVCKKA